MPPLYNLKVGALSRSGRGRRSIYPNATLVSGHSQNEVAMPYLHHKEVDDQLILVVPLDHTRPRYRILQLQPSLKQMV
jgi:hypothetical protein